MRRLACLTVSAISFFFIPHYQNGYTALIIAAFKGHTRIATMLLDKGANINTGQDVRQLLLMLHTQLSLVFYLTPSLALDLCTPPSLYESVQTHLIFIIEDPELTHTYTHVHMYYYIL